MQLVHSATNSCVNLGALVTGFEKREITVFYYWSTMLATVGSIAYGAIHKAAWNSRPYQLALGCFLLSRCLMQYVAFLPILRMGRFWDIEIMTLGMWPATRLDWSEKPGASLMKPSTSVDNEDDINTDSNINLIKSKPNDSQNSGIGVGGSRRSSSTDNGNGDVSSTRHQQPHDESQSHRSTITADVHIQQQQVGDTNDDLGLLNVFSRSGGGSSDERLMCQTGDYHSPSEAPITPSSSSSSASSSLDDDANVRSGGGASDERLMCQTGDYHFPSKAPTTPSSSSSSASSSCTTSPQQNSSSVSGASSQNSQKDVVSSDDQSALRPFKRKKVSFLESPSPDGHRPTESSGTMSSSSSSIAPSGSTNSAPRGPIRGIIKWSPLETCIQNSEISIPHERHQHFYGDSPPQERSDGDSDLSSSESEVSDSVNPQQQQQVANGRDEDALYESSSSPSTNSSSSVFVSSASSSQQLNDVSIEIASYAASNVQDGDIEANNSVNPQQQQVGNANTLSASHYRSAIERLTPASFPL